MSNQERQIAYRQVVQAILECPQNDEERILAANSDLVDEGLVKALKDKAMMMMRRNSPELGATMQRLVNLAQQLERKLASAKSETVELEQDDYIRFSFELFQIVARSKGDGAIVHQFLDEHRAYFNEHLVAIFPQSIAALLERSADPDRQVYIRSIAKMLAIDLQTYPTGDRSIFRQLSIACKEPSLLVQSQPDEPIDLTELEPESETEIEPTVIETEPEPEPKEPEPEPKTEIEPTVIETEPEPEPEPAEIEPELSSEPETTPTNEDSQITTYFQLVQALLECPLNQEDRLLIAHPELVDEGLVRSLLTAAKTLKELNNSDSVWTIEWLKSFAAELSQKLGLEQQESQQIDLDRSSDLSHDLLEPVANSQPDEQIDLAEPEIVQPDREPQIGYPELVQALLECPHNDEDRILAAHPELVDERLVIALLEVAQIGKERNNLDAVSTIEWLETFAEKLNQKLGLQPGTNKPTDDEKLDEFTLDLLQTVENSQGDGDALTILSPTSLPIDALKTSCDLGQIYFKQGEWQLAINAYQIAMQAVETSRDWVIDEERRKEMLNDSLSIYENAIQCAINLKNYPQAIQYTERTRSRQLVELMARKDRSTPAAISPEIPRYLEKVETIDYPNIQKLIHNPHTAILTCYTTKDDTHIFIIKQSGTPTIHTCEHQGWKKFQKWLQKEWINPSHEDTANWVANLPGLLHDISQRLKLDTLIEQHLTDINELIIVPHLNLHQIPFAALPVWGDGGGWGDGEGWEDGEERGSTLSSHTPHTQKGGFLGDRFIIRSIPSCQILQYCQQRPPVTTTHIGTVEDADDSLLGARYEGEIIAALYKIPPTNRLRGSSQATAANYRNLLARVNRLHSSHHASSNLNNPLESALHLAPGEKITLGDLLMGERYPHLDEVFLSACQTHVGKATFTNDIATLTTGFLCVGARSVQSTLWSVDDYASVIFNVMYHQERCKGTNRAISLHTAQSQLRNLTGAEFERSYYPHAIEYVTKHYPSIETKLEEHLKQYCQEAKPFESPFYWAAFITQGMA